MFWVLKMLTMIMISTTLMMENPMTILISIIMTSMLISFLIFMSHLNYWMTLLLILTFISGMMVMFMYMVSLSPNEKKKNNNKIIMVMTMMMLPIMMNSKENSNMMEWVFSINNLTMMMMTTMIIIMAIIPSKINSISSKSMKSSM